MADATNHDTTDRDGSRLEPATDRIRLAVTRLEGAVQRKPTLGSSTMVSTTTSTDGLRCVSQEGGHAVETDLGPVLGGDDSGPTPSALLRAALGSCLTMGYRLRAARNGIHVDGIRVEVATDSAIGGMLDLDSAYPPGFLEIGYRVEIDSPAPVEAIERLVDEADRLSPVLDAVTRTNRVTRLPSGPSTAGGDR